MRNLIIAISVLVSGVALSQDWKDQFGDFIIGGSPYSDSVDNIVHTTSTEEEFNVCSYNAVFKDKDTTAVLSAFLERCDEIFNSANLNLTFKELDLSYAFDFGMLGEEFIEVWDGTDVLNIQENIKTDIKNVYVNMSDTSIELLLFYRTK